MKCNFMLHFIWVVAVCQSTLGIYSTLNGLRLSDPTRSFCVLLIVQTPPQYIPHMLDGIGVWKVQTVSHMSDADALSVRLMQVSFLYIFFNLEIFIKYILKTKSKFTLLLYMPFLGIGECYFKCVKFILKFNQLFT